MAVLDIYQAAVNRGARVLGRRARPAPARVALLALIPAAGGLALASGAAPALAAGPAPSCSAGTCTVSFTTPGTGQSFTVPAGVSSLAVTLYGGAGGSTYFTQSPVAGGDGARVTANLTVHAGERLGVDVGGAGTTTTDTLGASTAGGANGGGDGFDSGGGGGATDITAGGTSLVVAGGGGGAGTTQPADGGICLAGDPEFAAGGAGGNADSPGAAGQSLSGDIPLPGGTAHETLEGGHGGAPGTTAGPGAGGMYGFPDTSAGFGNCPGNTVAAGGTGGDGSGTAGGSGSEDPNDGGTDPTGGGGGGIGAFGVGDAGGGGGGGGYFGGGAGGSGASEISNATTTAGSGGGGGGASYTAGAGVTGASVSDTGNSGQVNGGNGEAVFTYAHPAVADLALSLSCPPSLRPGQSGPCTLTVVNHGPAAASRLTVTLTLPANMTDVSCAGGCSCTRSLLTWTSSSLAAGASVGYTATVKAAKPGNPQLLGTAASGTPDPNTRNNTATASIAVKQN